MWFISISSLYSFFCISPLHSSFVLLFCIAIQCNSVQLWMWYEQLRSWAKANKKLVAWTQWYPYFSLSQLGIGHEANRRINLGLNVIYLYYFIHWYSSASTLMRLWMWEEITTQSRRKQETRNKKLWMYTPMLCLIDLYHKLWWKTQQNKRINLGARLFIFIICIFSCITLFEFWM